MPAPRLIALDEEATGPRSAAEFAAFRAAHEALPHAALRRIADHRRAALILAHYHTTEKRAAAEQAIADANKVKSKDEDAKKAAEAATKSATRTLEELDKLPPVPDLAPCSVDRCPGHAVLSVTALHRAARIARPITPGQKADAKKKRDAARAA